MADDVTLELEADEPVVEREVSERPPVLVSGGSTRRGPVRAFWLSLVASMSAIAGERILVQAGVSDGWAVIWAVVVAVGAGMICAVPLLIGPARWTRAQIDALADEVEGLGGVDRRKSFESLRLGCDHELARLASVIRETMISSHRDKLSAARMRREMAHLVGERTRIATAHLSKLASTDPLTGLPNRRHFDDMLPKLIEEARRGSRELTMLLIDMDMFKLVNDTHGHDAGDSVLIALGELLQAQFRIGDVTARLGGDEFAVIMPDVGEPQVIAAAARLQSLFGSSPHITRLEHPKPSLSMGFSMLQRDRLGSPQELVQSADRALYAAKRAGRGRVRSVPGPAAA